MIEEQTSRHTQRGRTAEVGPILGLIVWLTSCSKTLLTFSLFQKIMLQ